MKAYKIEILIIDHDEVGEEEIKNVLETTKFPNWCIDPEVKNIKSADIGEWTDDHPLNKAGTCERVYQDLFIDQ